MKKVLVIGSGGREHAICWKLLENKDITTVFVLPGSAAIAQLKNVKIVNDLDLKDFKVCINNVYAFSWHFLISHT